MGIRKAKQVLNEDRVVRDFSPGSAEAVGIPKVIPVRVCSGLQKLSINLVVQGHVAQTPARVAIVPSISLTRR